MKAYKPQSLNPDKHHMMPNEYPWLTETVQPNVDYTGWIVVTDAEYTDIVNTYLPAYNEYLKYSVSQRINKAMEFGKKLIVDYGVKNILRGYTTTNVRDISIKLGLLQSLLLSGSLYAALDEITSIQVDSLVTQEDKDEFTLKINEYLGL